jgi:uncharacterized protein DUF2852
MALAGFLDDIGRPAWIGLTVLSFIFFPPIGLVLLGYVVGSGRMGCWGRRRWQDGADRMQQGMDRMRQGVGRMQAAAERWCGPRERPTGHTGNRAFDEYRTETLRRLEEEQRDFMDFLDRLRHAKDKAEFDEFMAERGRRGGPSPEPQQS